MSVFGTIMSKIFGHAPDAPPTAPAGVPEATAAAAPPPMSDAPAAPPAAAAEPVDVAAVLTALAAKNPQKLDWSHSIVDMMKLLDMDSSLAARKELASELHYTGDTNDSATMNIWLHKQVMVQLAANGGKVPDALKH